MEPSSFSKTVTSHPFDKLSPEVIFTAVETLGGRCTGRYLQLNAMENRVFDVELEDKTHVVIKFYRPNRWSWETLQSEHDFLKALEDNEVPVVRPLSKEGKSLFEMAGISYAVFPKRAGRLEAELKESQLERLGRFLARIHNVGEAFPKVPRQRLDPQTFGRASLETLLKLEKLPPTVKPKYQLLVDEICRNIEPLFTQYKSILLHGDCHCGNVLWNGDEPFFIDFDDILYAPPVQDLWMLTGADDEYGKKMRERVIDSYLEIRDFDETSFVLVEPLRALRMIQFNTWIGIRWEDPSFQRTFPSYGSERYWQEQIEGLSVQLEKIRRS